MSSLQDLRPKHTVAKRPYRIWGIVIAVGFQALVVTGLVLGLNKATVDMLRANLEAAVVSEEQKNDLPPPPPPPDFKPPPAVVAPPEVNIDLSEAPAPTPSITVQTEKPKEVPTTPAVSAKSLPRCNTIKESDYPELSKRLNEEGTVTVNILIQEDGKVGDVQLVKTSGFPRLDDQTVQVVKSRWCFTPAQAAGGKPMAYRYTLPVIWKIKKGL